MKEIYNEMELFCIEFGNVKEARGLFRLLKNLENEEEIGTPQPSGAACKGK